MRTVEGVLRGYQLKGRLDELASVVTRHFHESERSRQNALEHAMFCGQALQEAYERLGRRSKWRKWRNANFPGSPESARVYRRIWRQRDHVNILKARQEGIDPTSIREFLRIVSGKKPKPTSPIQPSKADELRAWLRRAIAARLRGLQTAELSVLAEDFDSYFWDKLYGELQDVVCLEVCDDYYPEFYREEQRVKRQVRRRVAGDPRP